MVDECVCQRLIGSFTDLSVVFFTDLSGYHCLTIHVFCIFWLIIFLDQWCDIDGIVEPQGVVFIEHGDEAF